MLDWENNPLHRTIIELYEIYFDRTFNLTTVQWFRDGLGTLWSEEKAKPTYTAQEIMEKIISG